MQHAKSTDGTEIGYETHGSGEALVLVHGSTASSDHWRPFLPHLEDVGQLVALDRRGRASSGDAEGYGLDRAVDDVEIVLENAGASRLFGHSFGGLCAINAAERGSVDLESLVLFEPAILVGEHREYEVGAQMADLLDEGDREGVMRLAFEQVGIEDVESLPHWPEVVDLAEVTQREFAAVDAYELPETLAIETETLVLTGEHSPEFLRDAAREVHDRLPNGELVEIEGVGHAGVENPPAVAEPVLEFLEE